MAELRRQLRLSHSPQTLFDIVADVGAYPEFLPWLDRVEFLERRESHFEASLQVARAGAHTEYVLAYSLKPHERITMELVDGPMHRLDGTWSFQSSGNDTLMALHLDYEFSNPLFSMMFGIAFRAAIDDLLDHIASRADELDQ